MSPAQRIDGISVPLTALMVSYDLTASLIHGKASAAGLVELALVRDNVALTTDLQVSTDIDPGASHFVRLDSQLQVSFPRNGRVLIGGDFISAGGQSQRALRLGGVQFASDYSLRPDLVTTPLPSFTGQVAVPTGIDLINGDQRLTLGEVQPGEFTVRNVPANAGRGELSVITRDSLGREVVQSARFYISRSLLTRNLSEFAVNAGFVRRRYGFRSMDYGPLAASAYFRRGISSRLTVEGTAEWTSGLANIGTRGDLALGGIALATLEARYSHDSAGGTVGTLVALGLESSGRRISGRIGVTLPSTGYRDVAYKLGDAAQPRQFFAQMSFDLRHNRQFQFSATRQERRYDLRFPRVDLHSDIVSATFRARLRKSVDFFGSVGWHRADKSTFSAFAGLSVQLGGGRNAQATVNRSGRSTNGSIGFARHDIEGIPVGYAFEQSLGQSSRTAASLAYRSPWGRAEGQVERVGGAIGLRGNVRGTFIAAGGAIFARNQTGGSYALVQTGKIDGIAVMRENRLAGVTHNKGLLLIENIPAQVPITFDVDADKLPADVLSRDTHRRIVVPRHAVGLVALDVVRFIPRQVRLLDAAGLSLAAGTTLTALPSGASTMVGFDGVVDFNAGSDDRQLALRSETGVACIADVEIANLGEDSPVREMPTFVCRVPSRSLLAEDGAAKKMPPVQAAEWKRLNRE
ncbi:MAG: fimbria/pilus outer membrane usher protein [Croceibacterium sp.]